MQTSENPVKIRFVDPVLGTLEATTELSGVEELRLFKRDVGASPAVGTEVYTLVYKRYRDGEETTDDIELYFPSMLGFTAHKNHRCRDLKPQYSPWPGEPYLFSDFVDKMPDKEEVLRAARACLFGIADLYVANNCSWENCPENENGLVCIYYCNNQGSGCEYEDVDTCSEKDIEPGNGDYLLIHNTDVVKLVEENCKGLSWEDWSGTVGAKCGDEKWIKEAVDRFARPIVDTEGFGKPNCGPINALPDWAWCTLSMYEHSARSWSVDDTKNLNGADGVLYCDPDWIKEMRESGRTDDEIKASFNRNCEYAAHLMSDCEPSYEICKMGIGPLGNILWHEADGPFFSDSVKQDMEDYCRNCGERVKYEVINDNE